MKSSDNTTPNLSPQNPDQSRTSHTDALNDNRNNGLNYTEQSPTSLYSSPKLEALDHLKTVDPSKMDGKNLANNILSSDSDFNMYDVIEDVEEEYTENPLTKSM